MTETELQLLKDQMFLIGRAQGQMLKNQVGLMYALMALGRMVGFSDHDKLVKLLHPMLNATEALIDDVRAQARD